MNYRLDMVLLSDLDWQDDSFSIEGFGDRSPLLDSLRRYGLIHPPWLLERRGGGYTIVDGWVRLMWLRDGGGEGVSAMIFPADTDQRDLLLRRVEGKLFGPPLNTAEKARIVSLLHGKIRKEVMNSRILPALGIPRRPGEIERWIGLAGMDADMLSAVASDRISERSALELIGWEEEARELMVYLLSELRCTASIQTEVLERVSEIARREGVERVEVLLEIGPLAAEGGGNHRERTRVLRDLLSRWRFPRLYAREELFRRRVSELSLPHGVRLSHPQAFEGEGWQVQLTFADPHELQSILNELLELSTSESLKNIMADGGDL